MSSDKKGYGSVSWPKQSQEIFLLLKHYEVNILFVYHYFPNQFLAIYIYGPRILNFYCMIFYPSFFS